MRTIARQAIILLAGMAAVVGCRQEVRYEKPLTPVRVQPLENQTLSGAVRYSATITPYAQVQLASKVNGYVREILQIPGADGRRRDVQAGDTVTKGTVLARINETDYAEKVNMAKAQLAQAQAALEKGKQDFARASALLATQSITGPDYDAAKQEFESAQAAVSGARAQLTEAEQNLRYCALTAPMDGVVLQRNIEVGSLVGPGTTEFVLADVSAVKVVFGVPDRMLPRLQLGKKLEILTESLRDTPFVGTMTAIAPAANQQSRVFNIEVTVPNPHNHLKAGMIAALQLADEQVTEPHPVAPLGAIVRSPQNAGDYAMFVVEEQNGASVARLRPVELGEVYGNRIAVTTGARVGERVIVTGATIVRDGEPVRVMP